MKVATLHSFLQDISIWKYTPYFALVVGTVVNIYIFVCICTKKQTWCMYYFSGPQTIADLQQKLLQLTSQPSERVLTGTPPSHPATPQVQHTYDSYMQTLHQKLTSISMPSGHCLVSRLKTDFVLCLL